MFACDVVDLILGRYVLYWKRTSCLAALHISKHCTFWWAWRCLSSTSRGRTRAPYLMAPPPM